MREEANPLATPIVDVAFQSRRHMARGPLQQPDAKLLLELLDRRGRTRSGHAKVRGSGAETLALHHADQQAHAVKSIQLFGFPEQTCPEP
jgi:hypothetical protein